MVFLYEHCITPELGIYSIRGTWDHRDKAYALCPYGGPQSAGDTASQWASASLFIIFQCTATVLSALYV